MKIKEKSSKLSLLDSCEILNAANYANILILYHSNEFSLINEFLTYLYICMCMYVKTKWKKKTNETKILNKYIYIYVYIFILMFNKTKYNLTYILSIFMFSK